MNRNLPSDWYKHKGESNPLENFLHTNVIDFPRGDTAARLYGHLDNLDAFQDAKDAIRVADHDHSLANMERVEATAQALRSGRGRR